MCVRRYMYVCIDAYVVYVCQHVLIGGKRVHLSLYGLPAIAAGVSSHTQQSILSLE